MRLRLPGIPRVRHRPAYVSLVRNRVLRVQSLADAIDRLDELETGVPEQVRQRPDLDRYLDELERDVMTLIATRVEQPEERG